MARGLMSLSYAEPTAKHARALASKAVEFELKKNWTEALDTYVRATDMLLALARSSPQAHEHYQLAARLLERAEKVKEKIQVDQLEWELWTNDPQNAEFETSGEFTEDVCGRPALSTQHRQLGGRMRRATSIPYYIPDAQLRGGDIQQGSVTDCSFVAALEVTLEHDAVFGTDLSHRPLYPKSQNGLPTTSMNHKYVVKMHCGGRPRRIVLDDTLPLSENHDLLCVRPCKSPQLWLGLIEKAFLMARFSSYEFHGSDASTDLYMLTGWIPEHMPLSDSHFQREKTWSRLWTAWKSGNCLLTLGTGTSCEDKRLIPLHCYGITALKECEGDRIVSIVNPWKHLDSSECSIFHMSWDTMCRSFEMLCVNWNPALFSHKFTLDAAWDATGFTVRLDENHMAQTDQYHIFLDCDTPQPVWIHLERHLKRHSLDEQENEFIALHAFPSHGSQRRMDMTRGGLMGIYVSVNHTLMQLDASRDASYTVEVSRHGTSNCISYTLSAYASCPIHLNHSPYTLPHRAVMKGAWRGLTVGGPITSPHFRHNPQFRIVVHEGTLLPRVLAILMTTSKLHVHASLLRGGERVSYATGPLVIASSEAYTRGMTLCDASVIQPGTYTLVVSSFEALASEFTLVIESNVRVCVQPIPAEGAGQYHRALHASLPCIWEVELPRPMPITLCASQARPAMPEQPLHVELWQNTTCVAASEALLDVTCAMLTIPHALEAGSYIARVQGSHDTPVYLDVYGVQPVTLSVLNP